MYLVFEFERVENANWS